MSSAFESLADIVPLSSSSQTILSAAVAAAPAGRGGKNTPEVAAPTRAAAADVCRTKSSLDLAPPARVDSLGEGADSRRKKAEEDASSCRGRGAAAPPPLLPPSAGDERIEKAVDLLPKRRFNRCRCG